MNTTLTDLEHAGGQAILHSSASFAERNALALHLSALKQQGHAVAADELYEDGELRGAIRAIHYKTCTRCKRVVL